MKVYLAAAWSRQAEIVRVGAQLTELGFEVVSSWRFEAVLPNMQVGKNAERDVEDILRCDVFVRFSDDLRPTYVPSHLASGGRMFETGLAWGMGKTVIVVGGEQNVFDYLPKIVHVRDVAGLKEALVARSVV